ncbi:hypothetical protein FDECE_2313 [Fusarium decemcellulare]|nr:hypothetical protein FDECE_2313 [Fusarium decemcellulare]
MALVLTTGSLAEKAFIVTGGFSGIGLATVQKILELLARRFQIHYHRTVTPLPIGRRLLSGLVNSAGICPSSGGVLENDDTFHKTIAISLDGTWNAGTELLRHIEKTAPCADFKGWAPGSGGVSIVNVGSSASYYGFQTLGAYTASKHAVLGLTRTWALDFAGHRVRVNLVAPGGTRTPLSKAQFDSQERGDMSREVYPTIPTKRFGEPKELANSILLVE